VGVWDTRRSLGGRRLLPLLWLVVLVIGSPGSAATRAAAPDDVRVRFTWWGDERRRELVERQLDLFRAAHPRIEVRTGSSGFDAYTAGLRQAFAAGTAPDVVTLTPSDPRAYGTDGELLDLTTVADLVHLDAFPPDALGVGSVGASVYALPTGGDAVGLLVNEDLVRAAGLTLPDDETWTWDDFVAWAGEAATRLPEGVYATDWRIDQAKEPFAAQRGHPLYTPGGRVGVDAATVEALLDIPLALLANGGMPAAQITTGLRNTQLQQTLFGQGRAVTMLGSSSDLQAFHELLGADVSIVKVPGETTQHSGLTVAPTQLLAIGAESRHPRAAATLVGWLLDDPSSAAVILGDRGLPYVPAMRDAIGPLLPEYDQRRAAYVTRIATDGAAYVPPPRGSNRVDALWLRTEDAVLFGEVSPADAAAALVRDSKDLIATVGR
jgi:multiple sugar transport system substrate-binding protein